MVGGQRHALSALPPRKRPSTHCRGGWVGPRAGLDRCGKSLPPPGSDPRTVQPVASRYTDLAIPAHTVDYTHAYESLRFMDIRLFVISVRII